MKIFLKEAEQYIGMVAGIGTTISFCPQVCKIFYYNSLDGLSIYMVIIHFIGVLFWITYGILRNDVIIIAFNTITSVLVLSILSKYMHQYLFQNR